MKERLKSFTFWFIIIGIIGIVLNLVGIDDINLYIGLNPLLNILSSSNLCDTISSIPYLWYVLCLITMFGYGWILDRIKYLIKNIK